MRQRGTGTAEDPYRPTRTLRTFPEAARWVWYFVLGPEEEVVEAGLVRRRTTFPRWDRAWKAAMLVVGIECVRMLHELHDVLVFYLAGGGR